MIYKGILLSPYLCTGTAQVSPEPDELNQLRKENQRLRMERDILKKTLVFFANESS